jgi:DNA replication and repair protein RecF
VTGLNGSGKTNLLEAIFVLATGRSFRADRDRDMIMWDKDISRIKGTIEDITLEIVLTTGMVGGKTVPAKKYLVNGVSRRATDFAGNLKAVLFWPEDLELVTDSPSLRRRYLDRVLVQTDREYRRNLISYERGLRQRNKLLDYINEGKASRSQLLFWNQLLIKSGGYLTDIRGEYVNYINNFQPSADFPGLPRDESRRMQELIYTMEYDKSVISEARLEQYKDEEVAAKATLVGPHRDDFKFKVKSLKLRVNDTDRISPAQFIDLNQFGSRGEQRLGILWLKLGELAYIQDRTGDRPILLLDDIFSELDEGHRELVLDLVKKYQGVITSAEDETAGILDKKGIPYKIVAMPERK